jgi:hypothetical protein
MALSAIASALATSSITSRLLASKNTSEVGRVGADTALRDIFMMLRGLLAKEQG